MNKWIEEVRAFQEIFECKFDKQTEDMPNTMKFHNHGLWLPFFAEITNEDQEYVIDTLKSLLQTL